MNNSAILVALQGRVSQEALMAIQAKLDKISEDKLASLAFLDLKKPCNIASFGHHFGWCCR